MSNSTTNSNPNSNPDQITVSLSITQIVVKYVLLRYHLHRTNNLELPTTMDKECGYLVRYIHATKYCDRLMTTESFDERLALINQAFQEWLVVDQIRTKSQPNPKLFPIPSYKPNQEPCLQ